MLYVGEVVGCKTLQYVNPLSCTLTTETQNVLLTYALFINQTLFTGTNMKLIYYKGIMSLANDTYSKCSKSQLEHWCRKADTKCSE